MSKHPKLIHLYSGEKIEMTGSDRYGRPQSDAGTHDWEEVEAILVWHKQSKRYLSIPTD
jgi:hypothetical protein